MTSNMKVWLKKQPPCMRIDDDCMNSLTHSLSFTQHQGNRLKNFSTFYSPGVCMHRCNACINMFQSKLTTSELFFLISELCLFSTGASALLGLSRACCSLTTCLQRRYKCSLLSDSGLFSSIAIFISTPITRRR